MSAASSLCLSHQENFPIQRLYLFICLLLSYFFIIIHHAMKDLLTVVTPRQQRTALPCRWRLAQSYWKQKTISLKPPWSQKPTYGTFSERPQRTQFSCATFTAVVILTGLCIFFSKLYKSIPNAGKKNKKIPKHNFVSCDLRSWKRILLDLQDMDNLLLAEIAAEFPAWRHSWYCSLCNLFMSFVRQAQV